MPSGPPPPTVQFGQSYRHDSRPASQQRCVNFFAERQAPSAKTPVLVRGAPGIVTFTTLGAGPIRGATVMNDTPFVVSGNYLYSFSDDGTATQLGGQVSGNGPVSMDDNGTQIQITNGDNGYIWDANAGFRRITSANFHAAYTTSFIDGFFANDRTGTNEWFISDAYDGATYSDQFEAAETKSDFIKAILNHLQLVHVFGGRTVEFWNNVQAASFPFKRQAGAVTSVGLAAPYAIGVEDNTVHFLGHDRIGYKLNGTKPEKITTPAIDSLWQGYSMLGDAFCFAYTFEGHKFVVFNFPTVNETWVFDISTGLWHERTSRDMNGTNLGRWRATCAFPCYNKTFVGDQHSGKIGYLDRATFTEFGCQIVGELMSQPLHGNGRYVTMPWLEVDMETGVGATTGQGSDPQIMLGISDDGGRTWGQSEVWTSMGAIGAYQTQVRFGPLGGFYERTLKLTISDPVRRNILAARTPDLMIGL